jgi:predicted aspartyl protease
MIQYRYNVQMAPPAPFVHVTIGHPNEEREANEWPAQLDTAADRTVIPGRIADELKLIPLREVPVGGVSGTVVVMRVYLIRLTIRQLPQSTLEVLASPEEPFVLLGRDVLNRFRVLLDGPRLSLEMAE